MNCDVRKFRRSKNLLRLNNNARSVIHNVQYRREIWNQGILQIEIILLSFEVMIVYKKLTSVIMLKLIVKYQLMNLDENSRVLIDYFTNILKKRIFNQYEMEW